MTKSPRFTPARIIIILTLLSAGLFTYLRSHYRELVLDEITYQYVIETDHYKGFFLDPILHNRIETLSDVFRSQVNHYIYGNGRALVHIIEQIFSGVLPMELYFVLGAFMMMGLIVATIRLCVPTVQRQNPLWWLATTIAIMYLFPYIHRIWYSINYSCNYLIPALLGTVVLLFFKQMENLTPRKWQMFFIATLSFLFGATHEGFSIPLGGGLFFYYLINRKEFLRCGWCIVIPMYLGILSMLLSPGNWARAASTQAEYVSPIVTLITHISVGISWLVEVPMFWVMIFAIFAAKVFYKISLKALLKTDRLISTLSLSLLCGLVFYIIIYAYSYAYTSLALFMLFITLRIFVSIPYRLNLSCRRLIAISSALLGLFIISQGLIAKDSRLMALYQRDMIERYIASESGVVLNDPPKLPFYTHPFVTIWPIYRNYPINELPFSAAYSEYRKGCYILNPQEYEVVTGNINKFEKCPGGTPFVQAGRYFWAELDSLGADTSGFVFNYFPVDFYHRNAPLILRFRFALSPDRYPLTEYATADTVKLGHKDFVIIPIPEIRKVKAITRI